MGASASYTSNTTKNIIKQYFEMVSTLVGNAKSDGVISGTFTQSVNIINGNNACIP